jgi:hypothetical protein
MRFKRLALLVTALLALALLATACAQQEPATTECPTAEPCPDCPDCPECPAVEAQACPTAEPCPECPACPECPSTVAAPFEDLWASSGHADAEAEAFVHWDAEGEIPASCANCHSSTGFQDFVGADGSAKFVTDANHPIGTTINCVACHNQATLTLDTVIFPSGAEITGLGPEAVCMQCHQGRASTDTLNAAVEGTDPDTVNPDLGFVNIHYFAAAATQYAGQARGGYQYEGKVYDARFAHVDGYDTCVGCHNSHSLELKLDECQACHTDVTTVEDLKNVRMAGSLVDYDGDGNMEEGIYYEIAGLQEILLGAIQAYAADTAGTPITYDASAYPYFMTEGGERYASWTPRLLEAAYNYQTSIKDPGSFAHGGKYIIQLLYDSIQDLNPELVAGLRRIDHGHFAGSEEAFRHWDAEGEVPASCATCHSAEGLPFQLENGVQIAQEISNGFKCSTCHSDVSTFALYEVGGVEFPSGATIDSGSPQTNLCINCHQGRSSTASVNQAVAGLGPDEVAELRFINVHYFAAGATLFGNEVQGAYQYDGQEYLGRNEHVQGFQNCTDCHNTHELTVKVESCSACHPMVESEADVTKIRIDPTDYDGDGNTEEGIAGEVQTMADALYAAMQTYAADTAGTPILYNGNMYPYFFADANGNGTVDEDEGSYSTWTPTLLKAAYNYQYVQKDPGAFAHNAKYVMQFLYDGISDLGGDVSAMTRP